MELYLIPGVFIVLDIVTGIIKAVYKGNVDSTELRKGLFRKLSEVIAIIGAYFIDFALNYLDLGIEPHITVAVITYICVMEIVSIIENLCEVNPQLSNFFKPYINKLKKGDEKKDDEGD